MIKLDDTHYVDNGRVYLVKRLQPSKYGYRITNKNGKRIWVTQEKINKYENDVLEKYNRTVGNDNQHMI